MNPSADDATDNFYHRITRRRAELVELTLIDMIKRDLAGPSPLRDRVF